MEVCLNENVEYTTIRTGFETYEVAYLALPEARLSDVSTRTNYFGRVTSAPIFIGAMTGGHERAGQINQNLARAAHDLGIGMMLGSQRVMLSSAMAASTFRVRQYAPDIPLIGNIGVAQLGRSARHEDLAKLALDVGADAMAIHCNSLQETQQMGGDTDFRDLLKQVDIFAQKSQLPVIVKEVGHGLSTELLRDLSRTAISGVDVAGAGATSWAKVEQIVCVRQDHISRIGRVGYTDGAVPGRGTENIW